MDERAQENLRYYQANQPLQGHLLPYLTAEEATGLRIELPLRSMAGSKSLDRMYH